MTASIHGHEVIRMMIDSGRSFTAAELAHAIADRFGHDARFHTCSADDLDAHGLIEFLAARGKFLAAPAEAGLRIDEDAVCHHDGDHDHRH
ncbi:YecH family protein [Opitutales bacterium ASA1]|uniref:YecH family metal-binding protein n=1 Tax=Congregicoccus parvus TaxID=3081749 RepID=UPI002B2D5281|nr:YecH family protein [Opitutales bacterium ASA1]